MDALSDITNFFNSQSVDTTITVGDPQGVSKFYEKLKKQGYNLDELKDILDCEDNMLIVSGAGSGKTTTLLLKIIKDVLSGKLIKKIIVNGSEYTKIRPILVSTFLKTGAVELAKRFDDYCKLFEIKGIDSNQIAFKTIHSEVYSAITSMGVQINLVTDNAVLNGYLRKACKDFKIHSFMSKSGRLTNEELSDIACILGYARNRLDNSRYTHPLMNEYNIDELILKALIERYNLLKAADNVQDFEDLEEILYDAYQKYPKVVEYVKSRYDYIYVDEFQDTSQLQYAILRPYLDSALGFLCIGDDDQCLLGDSLIQTEQGTKRIQDILVGEKVLTAIGKGKTAYKEVNNISKKEIKSEITIVKTKSGQEIRGTNDHVVFTKFQPLKEVILVYLMYRADLGFRIGLAAGTRHGKRGKERIGIAQRLMREKGDKVWVIKECKTIEEARYWETYYSYEYGIPQYMFNVKEAGSRASLTEEYLAKLHKELNTYQRGIKLLDDLGYNINYPHYTPKVKEEKCALNFTMFAGDYLSGANVCKTEIYSDTVNQNYVNILKECMPSCYQTVRKDRKPAYSSRYSSSDIDMLESKVQELVKGCADNNVSLVVKKHIKLTDSLFDFMTLGSVQEGMLMPIIQNGEIIEDEVVEVRKEAYNGYVYDISVPETRNFIANTFVVHNCIYSWRGSDVHLIQEKFEQDYNPVIKQLTVNRRCSADILKAVVPSIEQNKSRHDKDLKASKPGGKIEVVIDGGVNYLTKCLERDLKEDKKIGILARTNADLLIPACILGLSDYENFQISKSVSLKDRIPSQVLGCMSLITKRYTEEFEDYFRMFLSKYNAYQATKLCDILSTSPEYSIYNLPLEDIRHSSPGLFPIIQMLREEKKVDPVKAYLSLLEKIEQEVFCSKTIYAQRARDFIYYVRKIIQEHDMVKGKSLEEIEFIFTKKLSDYFEKKRTQRVRKEQNEYGRWEVKLPEDNANIKITTVHEAKGKEWDYVYIWNDVDGCFPNSVGNRELTDEEFEEERRVHYIAWTRPIEKLVVFTRSDRADGFLKECDLSNAEIIEPVKTQKVEALKGKEVFRKSVEPEKDENSPAIKDTEAYVKEYVMKYTNYKYICTPKGSILDACLIKLGGIQGLIDFMKKAKLESYPASIDMDTVISDILEEYFNSL